MRFVGLCLAVLIIGPMVMVGAFYALLLVLFLILGIWTVLEKA